MLTTAASSDRAAAPLLMRMLPDSDFGALLACAAKAKTRTWRGGRGNDAWTVNGKLFDEDMVSASIDQES